MPSFSLDRDLLGRVVNRPAGGDRELEGHFRVVKDAVLDEALAGVVAIDHAVDLVQVWLLA